MSLRPLGIAAHYAKDLRMVKLPEDASMSVVVSIAVVFTVGAVAYGAGTLGLFTKDVWRDPRAQFVVGAAVAGVLGTLAFDHPSRNEVYFLRVTPLPLAVASAWGLAVLARRPPRSLALVVGSSFLVAGFTVGTVLRALKPDSLARTAPRPPTDLVVVGQTLLLLAIVGAVAIALSVLARNSRRLAGVAPLACVALVLGTGLAATALPAVRRLFPSHDNHTPVSAGVPPAIGTGGIPAARWLRDHSDPAAVIATNAHCRIPKARPCDHRTMWIAGFTERQVLIEGWAYSWKTAAEGERQGHTIPFVEYWKPQLLADNDRVFEHPTPASVARLHDLYGVDWLFADKRLGVDLTGLERVAQRRHEEGQYAVFRIG